MAEDTIIIEGPCIYDRDFWGLKTEGYFKITTNGSLTVLPTNTWYPYGARFSNWNKLIVEGVLTIAAGTTTDFMSDSTDIYGTFNNYGSYRNLGRTRVKNGAFLNNYSLGNIAATIIVEPGGTFNNNGTLTGYYGRVAGNLNNPGTLAPGSSPGTCEVDGNYTATTTSIHNFEVGGTNTSQYDRLLVTGTATLNGTLNVSLISNFTPTTNHDLPIVTGTITGTFSNVNIPSSYTLVYTSNSVILRSVLNTLPVNFINTAAGKLNGAVQLSWKVGNEYNVEKYEIENGVDGRTFHAVGYVNASGQTSYSFVHTFTTKGYFYRIKAVDHDGKYTYSPTLIVKDKASVQFKAFPVPASNELMVQHPKSNKQSRIAIHLTDGRLVETIELNPNSQQTVINISSLSKGSYLLTYSDNEQKETIRFQKN